MSVLLLVTPMYLCTNAKRIIHVPVRLNTKIWLVPPFRPFGPFLWAHIYNDSPCNLPHVRVIRPTSVKRPTNGDLSMFYIRKIHISINYRGLWDFGPFWDTVWAHVQDKVAVSIIFSNPNIH